MPNELVRVHEVARKDKESKFTALLHHVNLESLRRSYLSISRKAAAGIDGVTWQAYGEKLERNLEDLCGRIHRGGYRTKASRRVYIEKADGRLRPLAVAALEDKVVQRAVGEVMNSIYEADFVGFSYGFRPGRSQHNALDAVYIGLTARKVNWVLDADIRGFFDVIDHACLMRFVAHRIGDKRVLRLIQKWLNAGVMEDGRWHASKKKTPQGATISPLLANIYLHYVLDLWVQQWRGQHARGDMTFVRYADDFVVGFQVRDDAERFHRELAQRLAEFSLELHPKKTRLIEFGRYADESRRRKGLGRAEGLNQMRTSSPSIWLSFFFIFGGAGRAPKPSKLGFPSAYGLCPFSKTLAPKLCRVVHVWIGPRAETFDFLGFTHISGKSRKGNFQVKRKTSRKRMQAKLKRIKTELMRRRHQPIPAQGRWLRAVRGYFNYHAVPTNSATLQTFLWAIHRHWIRALRRRGQKRPMPWRRLYRHAERWLPKPRVLHPWPSERLRVTTRGRSPVR